MSNKDQQAGTDMARRVINTCLAGRVRQISRAVTARYDAELRECGITANQLTILAAVAMLEMTTQRDLLPYLLMEASTLSRNIKLMVENRWLATIPGEDRRSHFLVVSPAGYRVLAQVKEPWERAHAWATKALGDADAVREMAYRLNPHIPR
ncbi:MAG: MarR family winged helix-turn-helix transcriptional regulator [Gemmatimonadota bacterium]